MEGRRYNWNRGDGLWKRLERPWSKRGIRPSRMSGGGAGGGGGSFGRVRAEDALMSFLQVAFGMPIT